MLSNATNQPKSTVELGYICPRGLTLRRIHHFRSDLINNMDHMRISGTEPSSVILSQTKSFQNVTINVQKVSKQAGATRDGLINPQNYNFSQF